MTDPKLLILRKRGKLLEDHQRMLGEMAAINFQQVHALQAECPHPFDAMDWKDFIPMGQARGNCTICKLERLSSEYTAEELATVEFIIKD